MHSTSLIKLISYLYILTFLNGNLSHASFPGITLNFKQRSLVMWKSLKILFFSLLASSDRLWQWGQRQGSIPMWTNRLVTEKIFSENHCHPSSPSWKYALLSKRETGSTSKNDLVQIIITTRKAKSHEAWDQQDYLFVCMYYGESSGAQQHLFCFINILEIMSQWYEQNLRHSDKMAIFASFTLMPLWKQFTLFIEQTSSKLVMGK